MFCTGHQNMKYILRIQEDSWTPHAPPGLPWPGFGEQLSPSPHAVYSGLAFFSLIRVGGTGIMAVNFRLFTTRDWSLTSEWTHLNTEKAFDPNFTLGFLQALFFYSPHRPFALILHTPQLFSPLSFYHFISVFTEIYQFNTWSFHQRCGQCVFKEMPSVNGLFPMDALKAPS